MKCVPTHRSQRLALGLTVALSLVPAAALAAGPATPAAATTRLPTCPMSALQKAKGMVDIDFWESMTRANATTLQSLTNAFNSSQGKVHVTLVNQASYDDTWTKYQAGLSNGQLPAVAQLQDTNLQGAIDTRSILPVQACIDATHYSTADFIPRVLAYWNVSGVQQAMPFAVSTPVLYYNKLAFTKAGLDPNSPPATLGQFAADAAALKAHGFGTGLKLDPWHLETWLATANQLFVNNQNGRSGRATKSVFNNSVSQSIFTTLDHLVRSGEAVTNPYTGPSEYDNLLGIGSGKYGMTIDTSAALGTIETLVAQYPNVQLGVGPFPVYSSKIHGGIEPGGSALYISNRLPVAQQAAAWQYITFLDSASSQATWAAGTGYIPIRISSVKTPTITHLWAQNPAFRVAYAQLLNGANTPATRGSVIGPFPQVRQAILNQELSMYQGSITPKTAIANAQQQVSQLISQYNQSIGAS